MRRNYSVCNIYMCVCVYIYVCMCGCIYVYMCIYMYMCVCMYIYVCMCIYIHYTSIQMKCQGGVIFVHAPRLFYYLKRRIGYARCSLTGNKNYPAITKLTNTMKGYATSWHAVWPTKHARG